MGVLRVPETPRGDLQARAFAHVEPQLGLTPRGSQRCSPRDGLGSAVRGQPPRPVLRTTPRGAPREGARDHLLGSSVSLSTTHARMQGQGQPGRVPRLALHELPGREEAPGLATERGPDEGGSMTAREARDRGHALVGLNGSFTAREARDRGRVWTCWSGSLTAREATCLVARGQEAPEDAVRQATGIEVPEEEPREACARHRWLQGFGDESTPQLSVPAHVLSGDQPLSARGGPQPTPRGRAEERCGHGAARDPRAVAHEQPPSKAPPAAGCNGTCPPQPDDGRGARSDCRNATSSVNIHDSANQSFGGAVGIETEPAPASTQPCHRGGLVANGTESISSGEERRLARDQLEALVARGTLLLEIFGAELASVAQKIDQSEKFFGGVGQEANRQSKDGPRIFAIITDILSSFRVAWEEVHRDERWANHLSSSRCRSVSSKGEAPSTLEMRKRRLTPRRLFGRASF